MLGGTSTLAGSTLVDTLDEAVAKLLVESMAALANPQMPPPRPPLSVPATIL